MAKRKSKRSHDFKIHIDEPEKTPTVPENKDDDFTPKQAEEELADTANMSENQDSQECLLGDDKNETATNDNTSDHEELEIDADEEGEEDHSVLESEPGDMNEEAIVASIKDHEFEHDHQDHGDESILTDTSPDEGFANPAAADEGGDSSSQHDATDDEIFSDKSPRSSLGGSFSGSDKALDNIDSATVVTRTPRTRTPRVSDISQYDREYEKKDFTPAARGTPRPPFRTPSDVRAIQMSSPTASVFGPGVDSPRSSKRPFPTVSRLGSPSASAQYSPKNRTPSRFKPKEPPLVLLHATLLPLRWAWGDLINNLDSSELSEEAKTVGDAWRMLQDCMGDTVLERGILLGHPQNDYEVLEERLLEALELPMRRRARILECGHYLGPTNENTLNDDTDSEDEYGISSRPPVKKHWCKTCKNEIRYDSLGPGKIFRVKVYASNGLMKAGAWAACWKEMERVDVELEPVVEPSVQEELVRLSAVLQEREMAQQQQIDMVGEITEQIEKQQRGRSSPDQPDLMYAHVEIPAAGPEPSPGLRRSPDEERRRRQEERLREIYGHTPEPYAESHHSHHSHHSRPNTSRHEQPHPDSYSEPHPDSYMPPPSPRSSSEEAHKRRESHRRPYQTDSLPELLFRSVQVLMQDRKNVAIVVLSVFILMLALRTAPQQQHPFEAEPYHEYKSVPRMQHVPIPDAPQVDVQDNVAVPFIETIVSYMTATPSEASEQITSTESIVVPVSSSSSVVIPLDTPVAAAREQTPNEVEPVSVLSEPPEVVETVSVVVQSPPPQETETIIETFTEKKMVRVVETVTEMEIVKVTATAYETIATAEPSAGLPESDAPVVAEEEAHVPMEQSLREEVLAPLDQDIHAFSEGETQVPFQEEVQLPVVQEEGTEL